MQINILILCSWLMSNWLKMLIYIKYFWQWHCSSSITSCCSVGSSPQPAHLSTVYLKVLTLMFSMPAESCFAAVTAAYVCKKCLHTPPHTHPLALCVHFLTFWMAWADNRAIQSKFFSPGMSEVLLGWQNCVRDSPPPLERQTVQVQSFV